MAEWLRRFALKLLAPLRWGSNPMRGSCQLLTESCWLTHKNNVFLQLWKLPAIYNQIRLKNGVKHPFTSPHHNLLWLKLRFKKKSNLLEIFAPSIQWAPPPDSVDLKLQDGTAVVYFLPTCTFSCVTIDDYADHDWNCTECVVRIVDTYVLVIILQLVSR